MKFVKEFFAAAGAFLRDKARITAVLIALFVMFGIFMAMYGVPARAIVYAEIMGIFVSAAMGVFSFARAFHKRQILNALREEILLTTEHLPEARNSDDELYGELIEILFDEKKRLNSELSEQNENALTYFTIWAHQIKTPITAMNLALHDSEPADHAELLRELMNIERYAQMALCYIRLGGGEDFEFRECGLDRVIKNAVKRFSPQFIRQKIALRYEPVNITVVTDEKWLLFAVEQLISNALKYTPKGSVTITAEKTGGAVRLTVADTGIGILPEDLPRIFERGYTGAHGRAERRSTGLGLYLTRLICDKLGAKISAASNDVGTSVTIEIPENVDTRE